MLRRYVDAEHGAEAAAQLIMAPAAAWRRASRVAQAQAAFVAFSCVQVVFFLCAPRLLIDATDPPLDRAPYRFVRLLGVWEAGLMVLYGAACARGDRGAACATVAGRFCVVPYVLWLTRGPLRVPAGVWAFVAQDVVFASWTAWALATTKASKQPKPKAAAAPRPLVSRLLHAAAFLGAFAGGCADMWHGGQAVVAAPAAGGFDAAGHAGDWQLGRRSLGLAMAITGAYCALAAATRRGYLLRYVGAHHLLVLALRRVAASSGLLVGPSSTGSEELGGYRGAVGVTVALPLVLSHAAELWWWHLTHNWRRRRKKVE